MPEFGNNPFEERRKGLEEAFFKERDQQLIERMRRELDSLEEKQRLAAVTGIADDQVLASLVQAGVRTETLAAVALVPLIEVAWCDGTVSPEESDAVLNAAVGQGIQPNSAAYEMLKRWLDAPPEPRIIAVWHDYVREMARRMPKESVVSMKKTIMNRARQVAAAAGGFLGLSTISKHEHAKLDELSKAWDI
jgi:hypothetical protein